MRLVRARAPGKCILFGEHAVVYGYPAIAMAISQKSTCIIEELNESKIELVLENFNQTFEFRNLNDLLKNLPSQFKQINRMFKIMNKRFNTQINNIKLTISSNLIPSSGLGSSASISVALVMAFNIYYNLKLEKEEISKIAYELEKIVHGTPSGIDNTICTFGNIIFFQENEFHYIQVPDDFKILITYTNMEHDTKLAIEQLRGFKKEMSSFCHYIFEQIGFYTEIAELELTSGNLSKIGCLMNINQKLLAVLNLSNNAISEIVDIATKNGAYGSKLTGAGLGGCVISLGNERKLEQISQILNKKGYKSSIANIDREGVIVERNN
jgi:mevalonate kinase